MSAQQVETLIAPDTQTTRHREFLQQFDAELDAAREDAEALRSTPQQQKKTAARFEDIEFLLSHGETPENIARRTGFNSVASMERLLNRHGRGDLVERMMNQRCVYVPRSGRTLGRVRMTR